MSIFSKLQYANILWHATVKTVAWHNLFTSNTVGEKKKIDWEQLGPLKPFEKFLYRERLCCKHPTYGINLLFWFWSEFHKKFVISIGGNFFCLPQYHKVVIVFDLPYRLLVRFNFLLLCCATVLLSVLFHFLQA